MEANRSLVGSRAPSPPSSKRHPSCSPAHTTHTHPTHAAQRIRSTATRSIGPHESWHKFNTYKASQIGLPPNREDSHGWPSGHGPRDSGDAWPSAARRRSGVRSLAYTWFFRLLFTPPAAASNLDPSIHRQSCLRQTAILSAPSTNLAANTPPCLVPRCIPHSPWPGAPLRQSQQSPTARTCCSCFTWLSSFVIGSATISADAQCSSTILPPTSASRTKW